MQYFPNFRGHHVFGQQHIQACQVMVLPLVSRISLTTPGLTVRAYILKVFTLADHVTIHLSRDYYQGKARVFRNYFGGRVSLFTWKDDRK